MSLGISPWGSPHFLFPSLRTGGGRGGRSHSPDAPGQSLQFSQKTMQTRAQYMAPKYIVSLKLYANCKKKKEKKDNIQKGQQRGKPRRQLQIMFEHIFF